MYSYLNLLSDVLTNGTRVQTRGKLLSTDAHVDALSVFGRQIRFDLSAGFPMLTTKKLPWTAIKGELLWFLKGSTNVEWLQSHKIKIWDQWPDASGELGPIYGKQWRAWRGYSGEVIDQIKTVITAIRNNDRTQRRRLVVSAWNVADLPAMKLPPCHILFQFNVANNKLSCHMYQRSADLFLGVPFNIASYALLTSMVACVTGLEPGEVIISFGDLHIYDNHLDQVREQRTREPKQLPQLQLPMHIREIDEFTIEDLKLDGYDPHPALGGEVAI